MKTGYTQAAWRLLDPRLTKTVHRHPEDAPTWSDLELDWRMTGFDEPTVTVVRHRGTSH